MSIDPNMFTRRKWSEYDTKLILTAAREHIFYRAVHIRYRNVLSVILG